MKLKHTVGQWWNVVFNLALWPPSVTDSEIGHEGSF